MNPITCATTTSTQAPGITTDSPTTKRISNNITTNSINVSRSTTGIRISTSTTANVTTTKIDNNATTTVPGINQIFNLEINFFSSFEIIDKIMYILITTYENVSRSSVCIHVSCNWMPK